MDLLRRFFAGAGFEEVPPTPTYTRADLVRAIVGQQWVAMVTVRLVSDDYVDTDGGIEDHAPEGAPELAMWACAVDVVEEMEKA